ncbi:MAG: NADH-quinone oxidoreductase subunit J [Desulfovibrionales bacterium]|nr:MAG: NADH-quinone oxidoreductase subunit J [Desulfovibrionales bacterium]
METLAYVAFGVYTTIILFGGLMAVFSRNLVRALVGLALTLFGVAGCYLLMAAPFMALMQILIYVAAVSIMIFFAIMLTKPPVGAEEQPGRPWWVVAGCIVAALAPTMLIARVLHVQPLVSHEHPTEIVLMDLGQTFIEPYFLAFELISVILTVAMAGAVLLAFERRQGQ